MTRELEIGLDLDHVRVKREREIRKRKLRDETRPKES